MGDNLQDIESHSLGKRSALSDDHNVSFLDSEARTDVDRHVGMSLLKSVVFLDIVQVVSSHNDGSVHLGAHHHSLQDLSSDGDIGSEGAFLIDVLSFDGFLGSLESKSYILEVSHSLAGLLSQQLGAVEEHGVLFLESSFNLYVSHAIIKI